MSVYGGFCTRKQESEYNNCLYRFIYSLQKRCAKHIIGEIIDEVKFANCFQKLFTQLQKLEEYKYQSPKYSDALSDLAIALGLKAGTGTQQREITNDSRIIEKQQNEILSQSIRPKQYQSKLAIKPPEYIIKAEVVPKPKSQDNIRNPPKHRSTHHQIYMAPAEMSPVNLTQMLASRPPPEDVQQDRVHQQQSMRQSAIMKSLEQKEKEFLKLFQI